MHRSPSDGRSRRSRRKAADKKAAVNTNPWRMAAVTAPLWKHGLRDYAYDVTASMLLEELQPVRKKRVPKTFLHLRLSEYLKRSPGTNAAAVPTACWAMASKVSMLPASSTTRAPASSTTRELQEKRSCCELGGAASGRG
jgi:hypothetical protein